MHKITFASSLLAAALLSSAAFAQAQTQAPSPAAQPTATMKNVSKQKFLVHIHTGPDNPSKAALGFLVAATALREGHSVNLFLAGDGASLIGDTAISGLEGVGTGKLSAHYTVLADGGARFYVSGMSAKARGLGDADIAGKPAEFAMPDVLVRLAAEADVVLTY